jgi:hypothetical protein
MRSMPLRSSLIATYMRRLRRLRRKSAISSENGKDRCVSRGIRRRHDGR